MPGTKKTKSDYPEILLDMIGSHFLEAARYLREIQDEAPDDFRYVAKQLRIGLRKAYALAQINRAFHELGIPDDHLRKIGWTKLAALAPRITANNADQLLKLADETTATELKRILQGKEIDPNGKVVVLYLRVEELMVFGQAMQKFGATKHPRGWLDKEAAVIAAMTKALQD